MSNLPLFAEEMSQIEKQLPQKKHAIVAGHMAPDADSVGSALAFCLALRQRGISAQAVFQDDIPDYLFFLPGAEEIIKPEAITIKPDLVVLVDCASPTRAGDGWLEPYLAQADLIAVDHHMIEKMPNAITILDEEASAAAELVYRLLKGLGITPEIANCLYAGLASDTGGFLYNNTTVSCFAVAAELLEVGVDMEAMRINLFENRSMAGVKVLGAALSNMQQSADKRLTWTFVSAALKKEVGAQAKDCDNIASYTMFPTGAKVGIFFDEDAEEGKVKISFRSRLGYEVSALAQSFGGGGHAMAAGCRVRGDLNAVMPKILAAANEMLHIKR